MEKSIKRLGILIIVYSIVITTLIGLGILPIEIIVYGLMLLIALIIVWGFVYCIYKYNKDK